MARGPGAAWQMRQPRALLADAPRSNLVPFSPRKSQESAIRPAAEAVAPSPPSPSCSCPAVPVCSLTIGSSQNMGGKLREIRKKLIDAIYGPSRGLGVAAGGPSNGAVSDGTRTKQEHITGLGWGAGMRRFLPWPSPRAIVVVAVVVADRRRAESNTGSGLSTQLMKK